MKSTRILFLVIGQALAGLFLSAQETYLFPYIADDEFLSMLYGEQIDPDQLFEAVITGSVSDVKFYLDRGALASIHKLNPQGYTALDLALKHRQSDWFIIGQLIKCGADLSSANGERILSDFLLERQMDRRQKQIIIAALRKNPRIRALIQQILMPQPLEKQQ